MSEAVVCSCFAFLFLARGPSVCGGFGAIVVLPQDLEYRRDVLVVLHRIAYVALRTRPVRPCLALREQVFARLPSHGEVCDAVAMDMPDLALAVAERNGIEPTRLRGRPRPDEHLPLDLSKQLVVHPIPPLVRKISAAFLYVLMLKRSRTSRDVPRYGFPPAPWYGFVRAVRGSRFSNPESGISASRLPGSGAPVQEEAARRAVIGERCRPHQGFCSFFDGARGAGTAHVGLHPPRVDRVDEDAAPAQLGGQDARQGVEGGLGDAVARGAATHVLQGSEPRRDVDDAPVAVAPHEWDSHLAQAPRPEQVRLERRFHPVEVGIRAALTLVVGDSGVVHQDVEPSEVLRDRS